MAEKTHYEVLGVEPTATAKEIAAARRRLVAKYHPDTVDSLAPEFKKLANELMSEINVAYDVLKDPQKRAEYDRMLASQNSANSNQQQEQEQRRQEEERRRRDQQRQAEEARRRREAEAKAAEEQRRRREERQQREKQRQAEEELQKKKVKRARRVRVLALATILGGVGFTLLWFFEITTLTPDFRGLTISKAGEEALRSDFVIDVKSVKNSSEPKGTILDQDPSPNTRVVARIVHLTLSGGQGTVAIPDVNGMSPTEAEKALIEAGLDPPNGVAVDRSSGTLKSYAIDTVAITGTDPPIGTKVQTGTRVDTKRQ